MKINISDKTKKYLYIILGLLLLVAILGYFNHLNKKNLALIKTQQEIMKENSEFKANEAVYIKGQAERDERIAKLKKENSGLIEQLSAPKPIRVVYKDRVIEVVKKEDCDDEMDKRDAVIHNQAQQIADLSFSDSQCRDLLTECSEKYEKSVQQNKALAKSKVNRVLWFVGGAIVGGYVVYKVIK